MLPTPMLYIMFLYLKYKLNEISMKYGRDHETAGKSHFKVFWKVDSFGMDIDVPLWITLVIIWWPSSGPNVKLSPQT